MSVKIILKSGAEFTVECTGCDVIVGEQTAKIRGYSFKGVTGNNPLYIDFEQIAAIVDVTKGE